jgi:hypothetical protein
MEIATPYRWGASVSFTVKDFSLLFAGFVLSVVANALWQWWGLRSKRSRATREQADAEWSERLNEGGHLQRAEAASEIIIRALYWLVLGNVMFGVSGLAWLLDLTGIFRFQSVVASLSSFGAVLFLTVSMRWLRRYIRLKRINADATVRK